MAVLSQLMPPIKPMILMKLTLLRRFPRIASLVAPEAVVPELRGSAPVMYWRDVPAATKDYSGARRAIVRHLLEAIAPMTGP